MEEQGSRTATLPLSVKLIIISTFLPEAFSFYVGDLRLTVTRLLFLLLTPNLLYRLGLRISMGRYRFVPSDLLVVLAGVWMFVAASEIDGFESAMAHSGPIALEFCIGYWSMRLLLSAQGHARSAASLLCSTIAVVASLGILDSLSGRYEIREWVDATMGYAQALSGGGLEPRYGLLRAMGPIEHPILFGFICGVGFLLSISLKTRCRNFKALICGVGAVLSLSSAPILGIVFGGALLLYDRALPRCSGRWRALILLFLVGFTSLLFTVDPIGIIVRHLTFDPISGYDRLLQWNVAGGLLVQESPWFGLGFVLPEQLASQLASATHSIDSLWLLSALQFGIVGSVLIGMALLATTLLPTRKHFINVSPIEVKLGTALSILMFVTILVGFTVHLWGTAWILIALLMGIRAHLGELGEDLGSRRAVATRTVRLRAAVAARGAVELA